MYPTLSCQAGEMQMSSNLLGKLISKAKVEPRTMSGMSILYLLPYFSLPRPASFVATMLY